MDKNPFICCSDCGKRTQGCHSTCEKYIEAKRKHESQKQQQRLHNVYVEIDNYEAEMRERKRKWHNKWPK